MKIINAKSGNFRLLKIIKYIQVNKYNNNNESE